MTLKRFTKSFQLSENVGKLILQLLGLFLLVQGSWRWYFFVELEHCGHSNDSEKIYQVILAIRECRKIYFVIFRAVFVGRRQSEAVFFC